MVSLVVAGSLEVVAESESSQICHQPLGYWRALRLSMVVKIVDWYE